LLKGEIFIGAAAANM